MGMLDNLELNAWTGDEVVTGKPDRVARWALQDFVAVPPVFLGPRPPDECDWRDPRVGWGLVVATGTKLPTVLKELLRARNNAPVFEFIPNWQHSYTLLRNDGAHKDISMHGSPEGIAPDSLPLYLLIYGSPKAVPWRIQYILSTGGRCVGRIDLEGAHLDNYINALRAWEKLPPKLGSGVVWAVDHGGTDITSLMRGAIAKQMFEKLAKDDDIGPRTRFIDGAAKPAALADLIGALEEVQPSLVVTTSHGQTGPLDRPSIMAQNLGLLVDQDHRTIRPDDLLEKWKPDGAIWYAHACCAAGCDQESSFTDLFSKDSLPGRVLHAVSELPSMVAPLPQALLGQEKPLRAFIGHVEPTFDWTLRQEATGQLLTRDLTDELYNRLFLHCPVGLALRKWYRRVGGLRVAFDSARAKFNEGMENENELLWLQLAARDIQSTVILGDPAAAFPPLRAV
jgi:hypothetical protein